MNHYKKLEAAINEVQALSFTNDEFFFIRELVPKLHAVSSLMQVPNIHHAGMTEYLGWFQDDIALDIQRCSALSPSTSIEEKEELLQLIKKHIKAKLKVLVYAFCYFLQDKSPLFVEEKPRSIVPVPVTDWPKELYPAPLKVIQLLNGGNK